MLRGRILKRMSKIDSAADQVEEAVKAFVAVTRPTGPKQGCNRRSCGTQARSIFRSLVSAGRLTDQLRVLRRSKLNFAGNGQFMCGIRSASNGRAGQDRPRLTPEGIPPSEQFP
jgi:hypothetical protein